MGMRKRSGSGNGSGGEGARGGARSVQEALPLSDIRGGRLIMRDGAYCMFIEVIGRNHSLCNDAAKRAEADRVAAMLSAITVRYSIMLYPTPVPVTAQLAAIDGTIRALRTGLEALDPASQAARAARVRLSLLEGRVRPALMAEGAQGGSVRWKSTVALRFPARMPAAEAARQAASVAKIARDDCRLDARVIDDADEVVALLQLWHTPRHVSPRAAAGFPAIGCLQEGR